MISGVEVDLGCWAVVPVQRSMAARVSGGVSVAHFDGIWRSGGRCFGDVCAEAVLMLPLEVCKVRLYSKSRLVFIKSKCAANFLL